jgi:Zn-dependent protease with chaperone function
MTLILPLFMLPVYQLINLERSSFAFREETALFSLNRWLSLELWGLIPLSSLFMLLLGITSVVFIIQEVIPVMRDLFERKTGNLLPGTSSEAEMTEYVKQISEMLGIEPPPVTVIEDSNPYIYASGSTKHTLYMTSGLIEVLDAEQVKSAVVHELAHIARMSNAAKWMIFILRVLMFYNPIVLLVFRRIVQDDEHICDDITVSLTKSPGVLASTLKVFYSSHSEFFSDPFGGVKELKEGVENYSHNLLLKERIARLEHSESYPDSKFEWGKYLVTVGMVAVINYFVV